LAVLRSCLWRLGLTVVAVVATFGLFGLPLYWLEHLWLYCTSQRCVLAEATSVLVLVRSMTRRLLQFLSKIFGLFRMQ
jgi:hypothetical protein